MINTPVFVGALACVAGLLIFQEVAIVRVNRPALANAYPESDQYPFRSVAVLSLAYFATFGSELAVVSMLPSFFADTWGLGPSAAGFAASAFAFVNLIARPTGGMLSDLLGSRRKTLISVMVGVLVGYVLLVHHGCGVAVGAGGGGLHGVLVLRAVGRRRRVRHRAAREEAGQRADRRDGRRLRQHRWRRLPDDRPVRQRPDVLPEHRRRRRSSPSSACFFLVEPAASFAAELLTDDNDGAPAAERRESNARSAQRCRTVPAVVPAAVGGS